MNRYFFSSRLIRDIEYRNITGQNGEVLIADFAISIYSYNQKKTTFIINVTAFGNLAKRLQTVSFSKGDIFSGEGRLIIDEYENSQQQRVKTPKIILSDFAFKQSAKTDDNSDDWSSSKSGTQASFNINRDY